MTAPKTLRNGVAALIVLLASLALTLMVWTGQRAVGLQVPITLSLAVDDTVWVSSHGALHELDVEGHRIHRLPLESLGLPKPALHLHAVRRDDLLVSAGEPMRVYRCVPSQRVCKMVDSGYIERFGKFRNAVLLGANADGSRIVVSDNAAHRVAVLDGANGALLAAAGGSIGRFNYPGQAVWVGEKTIWLASADHYRIERFEFDGSAIGEPLQTIALTKSEAALAGRTWPMALAPTGDGQWWALVKLNMMTHGGLVRIDEQGRFTASAQLPAGADLTAVTRLGDRLIATDLKGPALHRLSLAGADAQPFGSDEFQAELGAHGREIAQWYRWQKWAQWALIGAPVLGVILLLLLGESVTRSPAAAREATLRAASSAPPEPGNAMIGVSRRFRIYARFAQWSLVSQIVVLPALWFVLLPVRPEEATWWRATALVLLAACIFAATAIWVTRIWLPLRVSVLNRTVRIARNDRLVAQASLDECFTDGQHVLVNCTLLHVRKFLPVMDPGPMRAQIMCNIPAANWLRPSKLQWRWFVAQWRVRPKALYAAAAMLIGVIAVTFLPLSFWRMFGAGG